VTQHLRHVPGNRTIGAGEDTLKAAREAAAALAIGASDVTRGADAVAVSDQVALLGQITATGAQDLAEGIDLLAASDDLSVASVVVAGIRAGDLEDAMDLASDAE
jgi:hypothetical protein